MGRGRRRPRTEQRSRPGTAPVSVSACPARSSPRRSPLRRTELLGGAAASSRRCQPYRGTVAPRAERAPAGCRHVQYGWHRARTATATATTGDGPGFRRLVVDKSPRPRTCADGCATTASDYGSRGCNSRLRRGESRKTEGACSVAASAAPVRCISNGHHQQPRASAAGSELVVPPHLHNCLGVPGLAATCPVPGPVPGRRW